MGVTAFADIAPAIDVSETSVSLYAGKSAEVEYYVSGSDEVVSAASVSASSSNDDISAKIDASSGTVTISASSGIAARTTGVVTLRMTVDGSEYSCNISVTVQPDEVSSVEIMQDGSAVSIVNVPLDGSVKLAAAITMKSGDTYSSANWSSSDTSVASLSGSGSSVTVRGNSIGSATITASYDGVESSVTVNVVEQYVESVSISTSSLSLYLDETTALSVTVSPSDAEYSVGWTSSNTAVVAVSGSGVSATLTAVAAGNATVTATVTDSVSTRTVTCAVTVSSSAAGDITIGLSDTDAYLFSSTGNTDGTAAYKIIYNEVYDRSGGKLSYIKLGSVSSGSSVGTLYGNSSKKSLSTSTKYYYSTSQTYSMSKLYFVPKKSGTYEIAYTAYDSSNNALMSGSLLIVVDDDGASAGNITVNLTDTDAYLFSSTDNDDDTAAYKTIYNEVYDESGSKLSYIKFGSVYSGSAVGTLYGSSSKKSLSTSTKYYYSTSQTYSISKLYFVPKKSGTYKIEYTAYDSSDDEIMEGYLVIVVGDDDSSVNVTVTVTLDDGTPYVFGDSTDADDASAASVIRETIYDGTDENYSYIMFDDVKSGGAVGVLYSDSDELTLSTARKYYRSGSSYLVSDLYFVPAQSGTYTRAFTAYDSDDDELASGTLRIIVPNTGSFSDVEYDSYYYDAVEWALDEEITTGTSDILFSPDASCTRAQAVTFLWRAAGSPKPTSTENPFTDVDEDDYYYEAVLWAVEKEIASGTGSTNFSPDMYVTRPHTVPFLYRYMGSETTTVNPFDDVRATDYYYDAVLWAVENGVTTGTDSTTFSPNSTCVRAQIITFLYRAIEES
ncbi:MAG: S-layer homology domain-containing protein [Oscillospiraceae bacterium]|nr:S-layer homology domain-containing protein [Oscillospiraceae bacterium]